ncbi:uncharacterized protein METZ01_LOCUS122483 [marine metagenome]|uniref:Uncharacterized protein n=1 Tax=marine metagenome TaxID=408172 RepID=A0A381XXX4_9ZZZZ
MGAENTKLTLTFHRKMRLNILSIVKENW